MDYSHYSVHDYVEWTKMVIKIILILICTACASPQKKPLTKKEIVEQLISTIPQKRRCDHQKDCPENNK